jgi:predicted dehydrogenase
MEQQNATHPIRTALCSFGMSGKLFHAPFIQRHKGFELVGAWERSNTIIPTIYPNAQSFKTYEAILADDSIELVIVNTPNITHYEFAKQALLAGKHVIVEKPFTVTVAEGAELIQLATARNVYLSVYHNRRYDSDFRTIKKVLDEKLLGDMVEVEMHFDRFVEKLSYKTHKETPVKGTGTLYDLGSHLIDQALQLFGWPTAIFADIGIMRPISKVDDYFELILFYQHALRVRLKSTYVAREPIPGYIMHGTKGTFIKPKTNVQEEALLRGDIPDSYGWGREPETEFGLIHTETDGKLIREMVPSLPGRYMDYFDGIYHAIRLQQPLPVTAEDGLQVIRLIEAAYESNASKSVIAL